MFLCQGTFRASTIFRVRQYSTTEVPTTKPVILRDFISEHLFSTRSSYFANQAPVHPSSELKFNQMWSEGDYRVRFHSFESHVVTLNLRLTTLQKALEEECDSSQGFLTPVEIFKPHYANALAKYIVSTLTTNSLLTSFSASNPFDLCEIGGGNATCCVGILNYLRDNHPDLYANTVYTSIDVSASFVERQKANVLANGHADKVRFINKSIFDYEDNNANYGFVICLELLDNLPHDKLVSKFSISNFCQVSVAEVEVESPENAKTDTENKTNNTDTTNNTKNEGHKTVNNVNTKTKHVPPQPPKKKVNTIKKLEEVHERIADPVVVEFLASFCRFYGIQDYCFLFETKTYDPQQCSVLWDILCKPFIPSSQSQGLSKIIQGISEFLKLLRARLIQRTGHTTTFNAVYIPTGAFLLFKKIHKLFPRHNVICADFTDLRGAMIGVNGPLVQKTIGNETIEESSYLTATKGEYDIFFPTNFTMLRVLYHMTSDQPCGSQVMSNKEFMKNFADVSATKTRLGYNPLLEDFTNTAFFMGHKKIEQTE